MPTVVAASEVVAGNHSNGSWSLCVGGSFNAVLGQNATRVARKHV